VNRPVRKGLLLLLRELPKLRQEGTNTEVCFDGGDMAVAPCSNCGSSDLRSTTTRAVGDFGPDLLPGAGGWFRRAEFDVVVCCSCGLTRFFAQREDIDKLATSALWSTLVP
jgi:hypothetical protein